GPKLLKAAGCEVTDLARTDRGLTFTRRDRGLPFNGGLFYALHYRFLPVPDGLNRYLLRVGHPAPGRHGGRAGGRGLGTFTAQQLAAGVNLASATADAWQPGGPWDAQASVLKALTEARHQLAIACVLSRAYLQGNPLPERLGKRAARTDEEIVALQRLAAQPPPYRFAVSRVAAAARREPRSTSQGRSCPRPPALCPAAPPA